MVAGSRRRGREAALQILFQVDLADAASGEATRQYWEHLAAGRPGEPEARDFSARLVRSMVTRCVEIDEAIGRVAENWRIERMGAVDRNVIRLAVAEMLECPETPVAVILDEAIEIAKRFGGEESGQFVNGVLDAVMRDLTGESPDPGEAASRENGS